ncbi:NPCBM/NEW2 domain-containing protein [Streptomyces sp. NPDC001381]|uniref:NPCBM/NEW2 domain-containing protein n=1 Tax=Streptomyces sp. NPDC001381 TaxID=3364567 RepID=UPI00369E8655
MDTRRRPVSPARWLQYAAILIATMAAGTAVTACEDGDSGSPQSTRTVITTPPPVTVTANDSSASNQSESPNATSQTRYLSELEPLTSTIGVDTSSAEINGRGFARSVTLIAGSAGPANSAEYNLGRHWNLFSATVGLRDDSPTGGSLTFEVSVDGARKYSRQIPLGQSLNVNLDVSNALRLKLTVTYSGQDSGAVYYGSWGNARLQSSSTLPPSNSDMSSE